MPDHGPMSRAVAYTLRQLQDDPKTAATRALARHYAALIDAAAMPAAYAKALERLQVAAFATEGEATADAYRKLAAALSATTVASDLGPKLLAALAALGMTAGTSGGGVPGGNVVGSTLSGLRERAGARRQRRAPAMDAPAPSANP